MSYTKRYIEKLVDEGKLCPACFNPNHDFEKCMEEKEFVENLKTEESFNDKYY